MKKTLVLFFLSGITTFAFSQNASILAIDSLPFVKDELNFTRYNPLNVFDNKSNTVYAVNKKNWSKEKPLIQVFLGTEIKIDEIKIKNQGISIKNILMLIIELKTER